MYVWSSSALKTHCRLETTSVVVAVLVWLDDTVDVAVVDAELLAVDECVVVAVDECVVVADVLAVVVAEVLSEVVGVDVAELDAVLDAVLDGDLFCRILEFDWIFSWRSLGFGDP